MGYKRKSNCDVELTIDALEHSGKAVDIMIFTADGDFGYLIEKMIQKGSTIKIVSHAGKIVDPTGFVYQRFAKKLRKLISENSGIITMVDIGRWKDIIKKEIPF